MMPKALQTRQWRWLESPRSHSGISRFLACIFLIASICEPAHAGPDNSFKKPHLVLVIVIDQLRADYLRRFEPLFENGGFKRLLDSGAFFENAFVPYLPTETAVGHATISTGCLPRYHGIVANKEFIEQAKMGAVESVDDDKEQLVGGASVTAKGRSPRRLMSSTIGDQLKLADRRSRVFSIAMKDRAAILLGGKCPDGVYWCDKTTSRMVSSTYYTHQLPEWADRWNASGGMNRYAGRTWNRLLPDTAYASTVNCKPEWSKTLDPCGAVFPHKLPESPGGLGDAYFKMVLGTPYGNEAAIEWASQILATEHLGQGPATDMLFLGLSANDRVGHLYGPLSPEVLDITVNTDRQLAGFFKTVDDAVGINHCLIALTADHGVTTSAHLTREMHLGGGFFDETGIAEQLNACLLKVAGDSATTKSLVTGLNLPWVFCSQKFDEVDIHLEGRLTRAGVDFLRQVEGVRRVFSMADLSGSAPDSNDMEAMLAWRSFCPKSRARFLLRLQDYWQAKETEGTTEHLCGTFSDRHVPIIFFGSHFKPGAYFTPAAFTDVAPTIAAILGIELPPNANGRVLSEAIVQSKGASESIAEQPETKINGGS